MNLALDGRPDLSLLAFFLGPFSVDLFELAIDAISLLANEIPQASGKTSYLFAYLTDMYLCVIGCTVKPLSRDHKPDDPEESKHIIANNGRIDSYRDQLGNQIGPMRVWLKNEDIPGLAMSRSFGDAMACRVGVNAIPEIKEFTLTPEDKIIVLASDGVWEFLEN